MRGHLVITVWLGACGFASETSNPGGGDDTPVIDAPDNDGPLTACPWPYMPVYVDPCAAGKPTPTLELELDGAYAYDTDTEMLTGAGSPQSPPTTVEGGALTVWTKRFILRSEATLRVTGTRPLMILSASSMEIAGTIDAGSRWAGTTLSLGAGANPTICPTNPPGPGQLCAQHGGSGGGGAAFGGNGGEGGEGGDTRDCGGGVLGLPGGAGGVAVGAYPSTLRGGCAGRDGSHSNDGTTEDRGLAGPGGGGIHLVTRDELVVSGTIQAGGGGGTQGKAGRAGGGGGGAGGMVGLEATALVASGTIAANGGGGGGGCENAAAGPGANALANANVASGGSSQGNGSSGGNGGAAGSNAQSAGIAQRGGGGGGGGVGFIKLFAMNPNTTNATLSPALSP